MIRYLPFKENLYSEYIGQYISFGIKAADSGNNVLISISDVSVDRDVVVDICERCTAGELDPIHLLDVIEDSI